jgi:1-aminocyclopropane-1-carboxylate deaminase/D-cysteine desulfhydrase-like pyridoxal-dependent ACC family enzyme
MRPRISKIEAAYILQVLLESSEAIQKKKTELEQLKKEVDLLRLELKYNGDPYTVFKKGYKEKKEKLASLEGIQLDLSWHIHTHDILIKKYSAMKEGKLNRSGWKTVSPIIHNCVWPSRTTLEEVVKA